MTTPSAAEGRHIEPYDVVRAGYANLITDMTREQLTHQALFLHKLAWDRGEERQAAIARAARAERVVALMRPLVIVPAWEEQIRNWTDDEIRTVGGRIMGEVAIALRDYASPASHPTSGDAHV